ncbi:MAG: hypothetical protein ACFE0I_24460 [Elainellaceae cyanobacterium]
MPPHAKNRVDYVVIDIGHWLPETMFRNARNEIRRTVPPIDRLLNKNQYGVVGFEDGIVLLQRGEESDPQALAQWRSLRQEVESILD